MLNLEISKELSECYFISLLIDKITNLIAFKKFRFILKSMNQK